MKNRKFVGAALLSWALFTLPGCHQAADLVGPLRVEAWPEAELTLIWYGQGEAWRMEEGAWVRRPEQDYEFSVVQRRYPDHWESTKTMRRRHPDYDGSAGPRHQSFHFSLRYSDESGDFVIDSSLGPGRGHTDLEFREAQMQIEAQVSSMAPFDRYRIEQHYGYEQGVLTETVHLEDGETPWVRVEEKATLFAPRHYEGAPTRLRR